MWIRMLPAMVAALLAALSAATPTAAEDAYDEFWEGAWFECELAARTEPPGDGCAMLDDDGLFFRDGGVGHVKVAGSKEADGCKKQQPGQCFRADEARVSVTVNPTGAKETLSTWFLRKATFNPDKLVLPFLGCTQIYHVTEIGDFLEARPDEDRCFWAQKKRFYLRRYDGEIVFLE